MKHSIAYLLFLILIIGCRTQKEIPREPERVRSSSENVKFLDKKVLTGYLYEYYQEKCPGTYWSDNPDRCIRITTLYSKSRIDNPAGLIHKDTVSVDSSLTIILDIAKFDYVFSFNVFGEKSINDMFPNYESYQTSKTYEAVLLSGLKKNKGDCNQEKRKKMRITECIISEDVNALEFSATNDLLEYALSPSVDLSNFGMPLRLTGDVSKMLWLVPGDSPILPKDL